MTPRRAYALLGVLTLINLLNYADRYVMAGMMDLIKAEFLLLDRDLGILSTAFLVVYSVSAPFVGKLGDRYPRKYFVAGSILLWSLATFASGASQNFQQMMLARACIGIGEAGYAAMAPGLIADLFSKERRGRMMSIFYAAMPIGVAVGYGIGGYVGTRYGWRNAFYVAGAPGLLLGVLALFLPEPLRGGNDGETPQQVNWKQALTVLRRSKSFTLNVMGVTLMTFAMGGLATWMPTFYSRVRGIPMETAALYFGAILVVAGFLGTAVGGWVADRVQLRNRGGYFIVSGWGLIFGIPGIILTVVLSKPWGYWPAAFLALFFLFFNTGPLNTALVSSLPVNVRGFGTAVCIFFIHMLGDALSPALIGWISDKSSLSIAVLLNVFVVAAGGIVLIRGAPALALDLEEIPSRPSVAQNP